MVMVKEIHHITTTPQLHVCAVALSINESGEWLFGSIRVVWCVAHLHSDLFGGGVTFTTMREHPGCVSHCVLFSSPVGALVVYDITKVESFENVKKWLDELKVDGCSAPPASHVSLPVLGFPTCRLERCMLLRECAVMIPWASLPIPNPIFMSIRC